ncbi:MAG TPA: hypothetical protein VGM77_06670 [Gemmatimonadales bacterium]
MRFLKLLTLPTLALAAVAFVPARGEAQISATIHLGPTPRAWGHQIAINPYDQARYGDWHTAYRRWTPVTLYFHDGRYFTARVRGSRPVMVYRSGTQYFFPPRDADFMKRDRRYNHRYAPNDDDYNRPRPTPGHGG